MRFTTLLTFIAAAAFASAQSANPVADAMRGPIKSYQRNLLEAVQKVPADIFAYKPTPDVFSFGEQVGHILDVQYMVCSGLKGEKPPVSDLAKSSMPKAEWVAAVTKSNEYCTAVLDPLSDADLAGTASVFGRAQSRAASVAILVFHTPLHYGNLITYMRLKGIVPPETERAQRPAPAKK